MATTDDITGESFRLLRQVRSALARVTAGSDNREHMALLGSADVVLNELMLRTDSAFYLSQIREGQALVAEGRGLLPGEVAASEFPFSIDATSAADALFAAIDWLSSELAALLRRIDDVAATPGRAFADRVCSWEARLYAHSLEDAGTTPPGEADPFTRERFEAYLQSRFPEWRNLKITRYEPLTGGFSKRTVLFGTQDDMNGQRTLILRAEQEISLPRFSDITQEFHLIRFAVEAGLPTPDALWLETDLSHFGRAFAVMEKAEGANYGWTMGQKLPDSEPIRRSIVDTLCAMHNAPIRADDPRIAASHLGQWRPFATVTEATRHYVSTYMEGLIRQTGIVPTPELVRAMAWLQTNVPDVAAPPVLVHHDFGLNNLLIGENGVTAILDWEAAVVVDPAYDILVMQRELAEWYSMEEFLELYRAGTGRTITPWNMAYAKVAAFAIYMIVYLNGRQSLVRKASTPIAMSLLAFRYIAATAAQLNELIAEAEALRQGA